MLKKMYLGVAEIIILFDVTNTKTMLKVPNWIDASLTIESKVIPIAVFSN